MPAALGLVGLLAATACSAGSASTPAGHRLTVVATTTQVADFARNIGGGRVPLLLTVEAVIVVAVPAVGAILAVALLVAPAAVARLWTGRVAVMTAIAVAAGAGSGLIGVLVSDAYDVAAGGAITVVLGAVFALSLGITAALPSMRCLTSPRGR